MVAQDRVIVLLPAGPSHRLPPQTSCPLASLFRQDSLAYGRFARCPSKDPPGAENARPV